MKIEVRDGKIIHIKWKKGEEPLFDVQKVCDSEVTTKADILAVINKNLLPKKEETIKEVFEITKEDLEK